MKTQVNVGQASRLSHNSNQPLERNLLPERTETGATPVLPWRALLLSTLLYQPSTSFAQSYSIDWFTIDGGGGTSTGGVYQVSGSIGQPDAGTVSGGGIRTNSYDKFDPTSLFGSRKESGFGREGGLQGPVAWPVK
jgi:hypothetical protein